jgi:hypothetical protein
LTFFVRHDLTLAPARIAVIFSAVKGCRWPACGGSSSALVLEDDDLLVQALIDDLGLDRDALTVGCPTWTPPPSSANKQRAEGDLRAQAPPRASRREGLPLGYTRTAFHLKK